MINSVTNEHKALRSELISDFLLFVKTFFPLVTGREFLISNPAGRESHFITIARELTSVKVGDTKDLLINMPPGYGKSVLVSMFVTWCWAEYPDCQFLYISYSKELATKHTEFIRNILLCPHYYSIFGVRIDSQSRAKEHFKTNFGGAIKSFGSAGAITGQDAGLPNLERFSGCVIMDDMHKPDEVHSDTMREGVIRNYKETILQRPRGKNVPIIFIGQRLHEEDLPAHMLSGKDERKYKPLILKGIDEAGNALYPEVNPKEMLLEKQEKSPYVFASQIQQDPIPAGGALFKREYFPILNEDPTMLATFITADTAETDKTYNDATAFGFWGVYEIEEFGQKTGQIGLHCINAIEIRVEPKDLESEFLSFYSQSMLYPVKPLVAAIEKKSTGVTLVSILKSMRGLKIVEVQRTKASGSKAVRYIEMQPILAAKLVSFTANRFHVEHCIKHMMKITANDTHAHDDFCDCLYDAVKIALIDKTIGLLGPSSGKSKSSILDNMAGQLNRELAAHRGTLTQ